MITMIDGHGAASSWLCLPRVARGFAEEHSFLLREELGVAGMRETNYKFFRVMLGKAGIGDAGTEISTPSTVLGIPG